MTGSPIRVQIQRLAGSDDVPLPEYQSRQAAGMDLHACVEHDTPVPVGGRALIPCGFALAVPPGYEAQIRPRSGLASKFGISVPNAPGTVDSDYRGEVCVALINLGDEVFVVRRGMRIAQMLIKPVPRVEWDLVEQLPQTDRSAGGFGHTGH